MNYDEELEKYFKTIIKNTINSVSYDISKEESLLKILTSTEKKVLNFIIQDFNGSAEGYIRVNQATEKYNISTSVFRTLFYKIKEYNIAEINSRGVKGTFIHFNNLYILKDLLSNNQ